MRKISARLDRVGKTMKHTIFIDGAEGTTGLEIRERLAERDDVEVLEIEEALRKDKTAREHLLNEATLAILCLPDVAARESVGLIKNPRTKVLDASTAHRVTEGWVYGLPEIGLRDEIGKSQRVAVPGCHASGFVLAVKPLVEAGLLSAGARVTAVSLTGYSGGGKSLIAAYEKGDAAVKMPVAPYATALKHKHLPEMKKFAALEHSPTFLPTVGNFHRGKIVTSFFDKRDFLQNATPAILRNIYARKYDREKFISVMNEGEGFEENGFLSPLACNGSNRVEIFPLGHDDCIAVAVRLDNLGKGAGGAAVQNMNLMLGLTEWKGL